MWPFRRKRNELISFTFFPQHIVCSWIQTIHGNTTQMRICAYKRIEYADMSFENGIFFNPTTIKKAVKSFLETHKQQDAYISFGISGFGAKEEYITMPNKTVRREHFSIGRSSLYTWDYRYMYQHDGQATFYLYSIPKTLILQYQLLAVAAKLNLITITTVYSALFNVYKYVYGAAFRDSQYALDMIKHSNQLESFITPDMIQRVIQIPAGFPLQQELSHLAISCGLFITEKDSL